MSSSNRQIPPHWLRCPWKGDLIIDKFLPFKTPLDSRYDDQVSDEFRFDVDTLFTSLEKDKIKIGLWIDLTNTDKFYDCEAVKAHDCRYLKLESSGQVEIPSAEQRKTFIDLCAEFISEKPLDAIGVHCVQGYNKTGYLIVSFLVEKMEWSLDAALTHFTRARPPGIYKQQYLTELWSLYGDGESPPQAPELPDF